MHISLSMQNGGTRFQNSLHNAILFGSNTLQYFMRGNCSRASGLFRKLFFYTRNIALVSFGRLRQTRLSGLARILHYVMAEESLFLRRESTVLDASITLNDRSGWKCFGHSRSFKSSNAGMYPLRLFVYRTSLEAMG